ncbi:polysaccharide pyruvyl transferase family protein [Sphingobacterium sp. FBM7-1]|uniref:polysaccharide pyruvyl transferase family protein n=1 Tax=Sphingobacterium sp. FBM7-1 TaxID=2886688 RepID=UPI001D11CEE1|nr:polysaccharide pyruvyl transferase family protein [Sphingobacterium sp. FBM7-1]MCC2600002.1 polysaccharide pyruvyl transferase family protein [Sphingobacterium sp. FBM7-1]
MTFQQKIDDLKGKIIKTLTPLITSDYFLLDLPYYSNIGDSLIWEGEEAFLSTLPHKCLHRASADTYRFKPIPARTTILMQGGGNFGDIYPKHQNFRKDIIKKYLSHPIVIFPVSVYYSDESQIAKDANAFSKHKNLTICTRDRRSYDLLKKHFDNTILLLPDMAFCIDLNKLNKYADTPTKPVLFLKRNDKELSSQHNNYKLSDHENIALDIKDWPTKDRGNWIHKIINRPIHPKSPFKGFADFYAYHVYRKYLIKEGVKFLSDYEYIYTTRLHGAILSFLLHKPFTFFDNSYGKNKGFYDAWLSDVQEIKFD